MAELIEMPKLSDTMSVGTIVSWLKKEGEAISPGDMIAEIETDKATMEMEVFVSGVLIKQYVKAGGQVAVGEPICAIGEKGEAAPELGGNTKEKAAATHGETSEKTLKEDAPSKSAPAETPAAAPLSKETPEKSFAASTGNEGERLRVSPLARKLASQKEVDLAQVKGSGPAGRIVKKDVLAAAEKGPSTTAAKASDATPASTPAAKVAAPFGETISIPVSNMRAVIATRLLESKTQIPHFYLSIEVDVGPLLAMRQDLNARLGALPPEKGGIKFSVNDFILKATTEALRRVPKANASWKGTSILQHGEVHLAFAVAVDDGLVTPTIRSAHAKTLREISMEAKSLIGKAQSKKLKPDEMSGSTFTVTNLGMFGITSFYGIINPPNAAILSVGATVRKPVVDANGAIVPGDRMEVGLSGDHRVVDGAVGAEFLSTLREILETPALMLV